MKELKKLFDDYTKESNGLLNVYHISQIFRAGGLIVSDK
jgi:hypothetical protein